MFYLVKFYLCNRIFVYIYMLKMRLYPNYKFFFQYFLCLHDHCSLWVNGSMKAGLNILVRSEFQRFNRHSGVSIFIFRNKMARVWIEIFIFMNNLQSNLGAPIASAIHGCFDLMAKYKASIGQLVSFLHSQISQLLFFLTCRFSRERTSSSSHQWLLHSPVRLSSVPPPPGISSANPDTSRLCDVYPGGPTVLH